MINCSPIFDNRGCFVKPFSKTILNSHGITNGFKEFFYSYSNKNVIRGMHFQGGIMKTSKLIFVISGSILDVVLNISPKSSEFGKYYVNKMIANKSALYVPIGYAHGFLSLENNTIVGYLQEKEYNKQYDSGILWNSFGMDWSVKDPILSTRDGDFKTFQEYEKDLNNGQ